MKNQQNMGLNN